MGAGSPLFSWLFPCWCRPKALSPGVSSSPILSVEQCHDAPKFQLFPLVTLICVLLPPVFAGRILSGRVDRDRGPRPRASAICPIVTWLSQVSVRLCRVSVRSSFDSARSLFDHVRSLSDRQLAQPDLCPIVLDLYPIVILLCLLLRVVCCWPDSFCDLLFGSSFVIDL
jgi:hypothetical protein